MRSDGLVYFMLWQIKYFRVVFVFLSFAWMALNQLMTNSNSCLISNAHPYRHPRSCLFNQKSSIAIRSVCVYRSQVTASTRVMFHIATRCHCRLLLCRACVTPHSAISGGLTNKFIIHEWMKGISCEEGVCITTTRNRILSPLKSLLGLVGKHISNFKYF